MIYLQFEDIKLEIDLFEHPANEKIMKHLPLTISLEKWGNEYYGQIPVNVAQIDSTNEISEGGIAYSNKGNYFCIFFGQNPAWPVDKIGIIKEDSWKKLISSEYSQVTIIEEK